MDWMVRILYIQILTSIRIVLVSVTQALWCTVPEHCDRHHPYLGTIGVNYTDYTSNLTLLAVVVNYTSNLTRRIESLRLTIRLIIDHN